MVVEGEGSASKEEEKAMDAEEKEEKPKEEEKEVKPKEEEKEVVDVETELSTAEKDKKEEANEKDKKEEANDEEKEEANDEEKKAEKNDLALLSETQTAPREERSLRDRQLDKQIRSQSDEAQAAFLQGAIPKVVFQHALAGGCVERV